MTSLQFHIHTDKENATSTGGKQAAGPGGIPLQGAKAKSFQAHKTPRRALGLVNEADRVGGRVQVSHDLKGGVSMPSSALKPKNILSERDAKLKQRQQLDKENVTQRAKKQEEKSSAHAVQKSKPQQTPDSYCLPEKEYMPPPSPPRDIDEDILPKKERASTYVHKLLSWRPPCFFGSRPDSEEEEEDERERQRLMEELDNIPLPVEDDIFPPANLHLSCEELDVDRIELPSMDDVPLPYIDEDVPLDHSLPLPPLNVSAGLEPHLGSLEMLDQSVPSATSS